jgi:hypothetical protein
MTHLIDDETVAKMGHPVVVVRSDVGHPPNLCLPNAYRRRHTPAGGQSPWTSGLWHDAVSFNYPLDRPGKS